MERSQWPLGKGKDADYNKMMMMMIIWNNKKLRILGTLRLSKVLNR